MEETAIRPAAIGAVSVLTQLPALGSCQRKSQLGPLLEPPDNFSTLVSFRVRSLADVRRGRVRPVNWPLGCCKGKDRIAGNRDLVVDDAVEARQERHRCRRRRREGWLAVNGPAVDDG